MSAPDHDFGLIESLLYADGGYQRLERHVRRLQASAQSLGFKLREQQVRVLLEEQAAQLSDGHYKVRVLLERDGSLGSSAVAIAAPTGKLEVMLAEARVNSQSSLVHHKTTRRDLFEQHASSAGQLGLVDVVFMNERGELAEAANSNVFLELNGELLTPPVRTGILPGVYREFVLETDPMAREAMLTQGDLEAATAVFLCNSVRGWRRVTVRTGRLRL